MSTNQLQGISKFEQLSSRINEVRDGIRNNELELEMLEAEYASLLNSDDKLETDKKIRETKYNLSVLRMELYELNGGL